MKTKIIAIEGIDGSGKTVQFDLLSSRLEELGYTVAKRAYPVYDSYFGGQVGRYLSAADGVSAAEVDPKSMALWFAMDRFFDMRSFHDGETDFLLINRYVLSNAVYQSIRSDTGNGMVDWVFDLEYDRLGLPRPDVNIFFDVDTGRAGMNVESKGFRDYVGNGKDVYEADMTIQERAGHKYAAIAEKYDDTQIVCCTDGEGNMLHPTEICDAVMAILRERCLV